MIGRFSGIVLECRDPQALAEFYRAVTGWEVVYDRDDSAQFCLLPQRPGLAKGLNTVRRDRRNRACGKVVGEHARVLVGCWTR